MAASIVDQQDLLLPLIEGMSANPPWPPFMLALLARTDARRCVLAISPANAPANQPPTVLQIAAPRAVREPEIDVAALARLGLHPYRSLRPGRVYALDEMLDYDRADAVARQREALSGMGIRFARWLRVTAEGIADAWVLVTREREDFTAASVATLSAIAPYLRAALKANVVLSEQRLLRIVSQTALSRLGVGQVALDETGRIMGADDLATRHLAFAAPPGDPSARRLQLSPASAERVERFCAECATGEPQPILVGMAGDMTLLLQPAHFDVPPGMARPAAIASFRLPVREDERRGAAVLRDHFNLSPREAALAEKLSRGDRIVEAGRQLRLTDETARNYSKHIYARTGARGQADLVRMVLTGLAPLA